MNRRNAAIMSGAVEVIKFLGIIFLFLVTVYLFGNTFVQIDGRLPQMEVSFEFKMFIGFIICAIIICIVGAISVLWLLLSIVYMNGYQKKLNEKQLEDQE